MIADTAEHSETMEQQKQLQQTQQQHTKAASPPSVRVKQAALQKLQRMLEKQGLIRFILCPVLCITEYSIDYCIIINCY